MPPVDTEPAPVDLLAIGAALSASKLEVGM